MNYKRLKCGFGKVLMIKIKILRQNRFYKKTSIAHLKRFIILENASFSTIKVCRIQNALLINIIHLIQYMYICHQATR